jgi:hypothetical protein
VCLEEAIRTSSAPESRSMIAICRQVLTPLLLLAALLAEPLEAGAQQRRIALVIGNDDYESVPKLQKARNDSRAMAETLKGLGFEVVAAEDLGRRAMSRAVLELEKRIQQDDVVLFFYAGHGFAIDGRNYLLPVDIPAPDPGEEAIIKDEAFLADDLSERFRAKGAKTAILVLDACRDNPFAQAGKRSLAGTRGLAGMAPSEGIFVLFSAGLNQSALDRLGDNDANPNSVFTRTLLTKLKEPGRSMVDIAKETQIAVRDLAKSIGHDQSPAYYDQIIGNVVLNFNAPAATQGGIGTFKEGQSEVALLPKTGIPLKPGKAEPIASFTRSNAGWYVYVSLPEPALQFGYRVGEAGEFTDPGFNDFIDQATGQRSPRTQFELPPDQEATTLYVTWRDKRGEEAGVFPIVFNPDEALRSGQKQILKQTKTAWVAFREYNGLLVYFSHLMSYNCAIAEVRYGLDKAVPDTVFALPPCNHDNPGALPEDALVFKKIPPKTKSMSVEVVFYDGERMPVQTYKVIPK